MFRFFNPTDRQLRPQFSQLEGKDGPNTRLPLSSRFLSRGMAAQDRYGKNPPVLLAQVVEVDGPPAGVSSGRLTSISRLDKLI